MTTPTAKQAIDRPADIPPPEPPKEPLLFDEVRRSPAYRTAASHLARVRRIMARAEMSVDVENKAMKVLAERFPRAVELAVRDDNIIIAWVKKHGRH